MIMMAVQGPLLELHVLQGCEMALKRPSVRALDASDPPLTVQTQLTPWAFVDLDLSRKYMISGSCHIYHFGFALLLLE